MTYLLKHALETVLELAPVGSTGNEGAHVQGNHSGRKEEEEGEREGGREEAYGSQTRRKTFKLLLPSLCPSLPSLPSTLQALRHVTGNDALSQPFHDGGLTHPRLTDQHRIVLGAAGEDLSEGGREGGREEKKEGGEDE